MKNNIGSAAECNGGRGFGVDKASACAEGNAHTVEDNVLTRAEVIEMQTDLISCKGYADGIAKRQILFVILGSALCNGKRLTLKNVF